MPIHQSRSEEIGDALIENIITKYCVSDYIIMDHDSTFMSSLMDYLFKKFDIKIETVAPYNHQLLQAEHGIKVIVNNSNKTFDKSRSNVAKIFTIGYIHKNTFNTPNLANFSPYELVFGRKLKLFF